MPQVWQLRGRYPNRGYPKIFKDATVGSEAKKLFEEAQVMLQEFVREKHVRLNAVVGFYPCNAVGDDIEVYTDETRSNVRGGDSCRSFARPASGPCSLGVVVCFACAPAF